MTFNQNFISVMEILLIEVVPVLVPLNCIVMLVFAGIGILPLYVPVIV